ncbi:unnamed protein product, partial [Closterium sp. Naga37s-1]
MARGAQDSRRRHSSRGSSLRGPASAGETAAPPTKEWHVEPRARRSPATGHLGDSGVARWPGGAPRGTRRSGREDEEGRGSAESVKEEKPRVLEALNGALSQLF